jgi:hypothetical protein
VILGLDGEDLIDGAGGDDVICGGDDHDRLSGGSGQDRLLGGLGNDRLSGGAGTWEPLAGGAGRDELDISDIWWPPPHEDRCFGSRGIVPCPVEPIMIEPMPMSSRA